jgi:Rieske Fe-S protein
MNRKEFLQHGCSACWLGAAAVALAGLPGCSPAYTVFKTEAVNNTIEIPLQLFEKNNIQFVRPKGWLYDIAVQKMNDGRFQALLLRCTHADNQLIPLQNGYSCSLHGSQFNRKGEATKGPAEFRLKKYTTTINNNQLIISI